MPQERFGFLTYSLEELHEHLKEELASNPFLDVPGEDSEASEGDDPSFPPDDPNDGT
jgi:DNA-directed RNA polymerase specialized sigma54-like protein